ncbi:type IV pilin N-terminal domain-containing protein [Haloarchaeobius baliensis]|uniref:type IV pilin N-terminal domain-containing protein n=1 Tax=Haloarchaeobius baliensis TaxID=1670458 RepID=UPI003F880A6A
MDASPSSTDRALSSVVSTVLLVAVVLFAAAGVGLFVFDLGQSATASPPPKAAFETANTSSGVAITYSGGEPADPSRLRVVVDDPDGTVSSGTWDTLGGTASDGQVTAGDSLTLSGSDGDETLQLIWESADGGGSYPLLSWTGTGGAGTPSYTFQGTTSTGDGFGDAIEFSAEAWDARGRYGDSAGGGSTELQIRDGGNNPLATTGHDWSAGTEESFSLRYYSSNSTAVLTVDGDTVSSASVTDPGDRFTVTVKARSSSPPSSQSVTVDSLALNGSSIGATDGISEDGTTGSADQQYLLVEPGNADLSDGFVITGTVTFDWAGGTPNSETLAFTIDFEQP